MSVKADTEVHGELEAVDALPDAGSRTHTVWEAAFSWVLSFACLSLRVTLDQLCANTEEPSHPVREQEEG